MGRPDRRNQGCVAYLEWADAMGDREREDLKAGGDILGHLAKDGFGARMTLVMQRGHGSAVVMVANISAKRNDGTDAVIAHQAVHGVEVEGAFGHLDRPNC